MRTALFFAGHLTLILFGAWAWRLDEVRRMSWPARLGVAFGAGAITLTIWATVLSLFRIRWSVAVLALPLIAFSTLVLGIHRKPLFPPRRKITPEKLLLLMVVLLSTAHLGLMLWTSRATSMDCLFFWGVKAIRFAEACAIDASLLKWQLFQHAVPEYPPLVPLVHAWAVMASGGMPWVTAPLASLLWFIAAIPVVLEQLRQLIPEKGAALVVSLWSAAMALSLVSSYSGGNAEAPLLFFITLAALAIVTHDSKPHLASLFLGGAVLTKVEGLAAAILLVLGVLAHRLLVSRRICLKVITSLIIAPTIALLLWFSFQLVNGMEVGYKAHGELLHLYTAHFGTIVNAFWRNLHAGSNGVAWLFALVLLTLSLRRDSAVRLIPLLVAIAGLLAFFLFDYMHDSSNPTERIGWTLPRISQPALSMLILAAGIASFRLGYEIHSDPA